MGYQSLILGVALVMGLSSMKALAWGERGHHLVSRVAAEIVQATMTSKGQKQKDFARFLAERKIALGHLANIPDTSWRDHHLHPRVSKMNSPTHYVNPERVLGLPSSGQVGYGLKSSDLKKIQSLPADYSQLLKQYDQKTDQLSGKNRFRVFEDLGTAPWRAQEFFDGMKAALKCFGSKKKKASKDKFKDPFWDSGKNFAQKKKNIPVPSYSCQKDSNPVNDLYAAWVYAGTLSHFVADLSQPHHASADYDGWATGNGGIHAYFETLVLEQYPADLDHEVWQEAKLKTAQSNQWIQKNWSSNKTGTARLMLALAADSVSHLEAVARVDNQVAIVKRGSSSPWKGVKGKSQRSFKAERRPPSDPKVMDGFKPLIKSRLAIASQVLAHLWVEAWKQAGSPDLKDINALSIPYPHLPRFIWPGYDSRALKDPR